MRVLDLIEALAGISTILTLILTVGTITGFIPQSSPSLSLFVPATPTTYKINLFPFFIATLFISIAIFIGIEIYQVRRGA